MKLRKGDLWNALDEGATLIGVTTNAYIGTKGLVMGRGAALEAKKRWPWLPGRAAQAIQKHLGRYEYSTMPAYGWIVLDNLMPAPRLGLFQVKTTWERPADLAIIRYASTCLMSWLEANPDEVVAINFPGIGNGKLRRADVLPVIETLPDRVIVYEYEDAHAPRQKP